MAYLGGGPRALPQGRRRGRRPVALDRASPSERLEPAIADLSVAFIGGGRHGPPWFSAVSEPAGRRRRLSPLLGVLAVSLGLAVLGGWFLLQGPAPTEQSACTSWVEPTENFQALVDGFVPGTVACLTPGDYAARGMRTEWHVSGTAAEPVVVRAVGDGEVRLLGYHNVSADHVVLDGLVFAGPSGPVTPGNTPHDEEVLLWASGDHLLIVRCEVRDGLWRAGIYVTGQGVVIDACSVHDNGPWSDPTQEQLGGRADNIDHGVYWGPGSSGVLMNSVLAHNLAYGVQMIGRTREVRVINNTIVGNGRGGVIWAGDSTDCELVNNVIADNGGYAVNAHLLTGRGNVAIDNLAWDNARGSWNDDGPLRTAHNTVADPRFVSSSDLRLRPDSPAVDAGRPEGAPSLDRDGRRRGVRPDQGAYEQG